MKFNYLVLLFLSLFIMGCNSTKEQPKEKRDTDMNIMGITWTLTEYSILPKARWSKSDANKLVFKEASISNNSISFNGASCKNVSFQRSSVSLKQYLASTYNIAPNALKLTEHQATKITTNCNLAGFGDYLQLNDRRIVIFIKGVAFFLNPSINH
ncbi:MAG: hypothetical protein KAG20_09420 [Cocleimonas sp.]|nr:hypothetical protein [Cocleimonas sp.]